MPPITVTVVQVCFVINCSGEVNWGQIALSVKTNSLSLALFFFFLCSWSGYTWRDRQSPPAAPLRSSAIISWSWESDNHCLEDNPQNSSSKCYFRLVRVFEYQKVFFFFLLSSLLRRLMEIIPTWLKGRGAVNNVWSLYNLISTLLFTWNTEMEVLSS